MSLKTSIMLLGTIVMTADPNGTSATTPAGNVKADEDSHINNTKDEGTIDNGPLFPAVKEGKYGFINVHGQFVIPPSFTAAHAFSEGLAAVYVGGASYLDEFDGSSYINHEKGKWGYIDRTGAMVIPPQFSSAKPFSEGLALVSLPKDLKAPSLEEYLVAARPLNPSYSDAEITEYWRRKYDKGQPAGYIDTSGFFKIIPQYKEHSSPFKSGIAHVYPLSDEPDFSNTSDDLVRKSMAKEAMRSLQGHWIDTAGIEIDEITALGKVKVKRIVFEQKSAIEIYGHTYEVVQYGLKDAQGRILVKAKYASISGFYSKGTGTAYDVTEACIVSKWGIIGGHPFKASRRCGLIDLNGNLIAPLQFDNIQAQSSEDIAIFTVGCQKIQYGGYCKSGTGEKGIFSIKERKIIVNPQFEDIEPVREGLMTVKLDGSWGFIDTTGKVVISPQFANASYFHDGLAQVSLVDYIDKTGRYVYRGSLGKLTFKPKSIAAPAPDVKEDATVLLMGTGFIISRQGHVLTNHHITKGCSTVRTIMEGRKQPLTIIATDVANDLALLQLPARVPSAARFREGRTIRPGDGVIVVGFPLRGLLASEASITTGTVSALAGIGNDTRFLQITAPVQPGNSGGPLLDHAGQIVGVVVGKLDTLMLAKATGDIPQNINFAINGTVAKAFLDANGVEYETEVSTRKMEPSDIGAIAKKSTLAIECLR